LRVRISKVRGFINHKLKAMKFIHTLFIIVFLGLMMPIDLMAQDFVYTPTNSAFGGNPYNYSWLINSATEQNRIEDPNEEDQFRTDPLDDFEDNLKRQILNQLSTRLVNAIFGEDDELETGSYMLGNYQVDVFEDGNGVTINVTDILTGNYSNVAIPNY